MMSEYVLIEEATPEEKTKGGIFIPEKFKENAQHGTVIAVGPGKRNKKNPHIEPTGLKTGDKILFDERRTYPVTLEGKRYIMVRGEQVLGVINESGAESN